MSEGIISLAADTMGSAIGRLVTVVGKTGQQSVLPRSLDLVDLDVDTPLTRYLKQKGKLHRVA